MNKQDKRPERADLIAARKMLKGRIDYHMKTGDPFAVIYAKAALWAVNYVLENDEETPMDDGDER